MPLRVCVKAWGSRAAGSDNSTAPQPRPPDEQQQKENRSLSLFACSRLQLVAVLQRRRVEDCAMLRIASAGSKMPLCVFSSLFVRHSLCCVGVVFVVVNKQQEVVRPLAHLAPSPPTVAV